MKRLFFPALILSFLFLLVLPQGARAQTFSILHIFPAGSNPGDGQLPYAGLVQGADGNFYGTTQSGGFKTPTFTNGQGVVYKITPTGTVTILHEFNDGSVPNDGTQPQAGLVQGEDGNFYGTTESGGDNVLNFGNGRGTIYKITPTGTVTILHQFGDGTVANDGQLPSTGLVQGTDGNFYGVVQFGGMLSDTNVLGPGIFYKITPTGTMTILHFFGDGTVPEDGTGPTSLILGADGNFYGTTAEGGAATTNFPNGEGTIFKMTPSGQETILHAFGDGTVPNDGIDPFNSSLEQGSDGNFYGTTFEGGAGVTTNFPAGQGTAYKMTPSGTVTILHSFGDGTVAKDGIEPVSGLVQGTNGNLYGTTEGGGSTGAGTIFQTTPSGQTTILHSFGTLSPDGNFPQSGVIQATDGNFYGTTYDGGVTTDTGVVYKLVLPTTVPAAPTGLSASASQSIVAPEIVLNWSTSATATTYNVYRGTSSGTETLYKSGLTIFQFTDTAVTSGVKYFYEVTAVNSIGESAPSNEASAENFLPTATAVFLKQDTTTQGNWKGAYGADGFNILTDTSANNPTTPSYATISPSGNSVFQWVAPATGLPTSDLQQAAAGSNDRLAGVWYSTTNFSLNLNMTDGNVHQFALYLLDFGSVGRSETVSISDTDRGTVLDTRTFTNFGGGDYEVYDIGGKVTITITKTAGNNGVMSAYFFDPKPAPPAAPVSLAAAAGNAQVALSWTASAGATSYNVYRSTTSGGEGTTPIKTGVTTTNFTDTTVTNGTTYFYEVTAVNANGESGKSNEVVATPSVPSPQPPILTATPGNAQVILSWTATTGATTYNVYRATSSGTETLFQSGVATTNFTDTTVTNGITYYYEVTAVNTGGESGKSNEASATPNAPPAAPTQLAGDAGNTQASLFWGSSLGATSYNVYRGTTSGNEVLIQTGVAAVGTVIEYIDNGLTNGVTYFYEVTAVNANGESPKSNEASVTPLATVPLPPTGLGAQADSFQINLFWNASQNASSYAVFRSLSPAGPFTALGGAVRPGFADMNVTDGTTYYYEVIALGGGGQSGFSNMASAQAGTPAPDPPTSLTATPGNQQVSLSWTASAGATSYNIYRGTSQANESPVPIQTNVISTNFTDTGLTNGTTYFYVVTAVNAGGQSFNSNEASATPFGSPASAVFVKTDTTTSGSWKGVYGSDGFNIITDTSANNPTNPSYAALTPTGNSVFQWVAPGTNLPTSDLQQAATGSTNRLAGVWYSATSFSLDLNMTDGNAHQVALYLLDFGSAGRGETVTITDAVSNAVLDTRTFTNFGTGNYEVYNIGGHVKITITKTAGNNCVLSAYFFDPKPAPPAAPTGLTATGGNGQVSLSWTASAGATSYNIYRSTTSGGEGTTPIKTGVTTANFTDTTVTNGTTYFYEVTAVNTNGESGKSNEASATPQVQKPAAPTGLTATPGNNQVALAWTASTGATSYNVYRATSSGTETLFQSGVTTTNFTDSTATNGTTYFYEVTAVNGGGESGKSNEASTTPNAPPAAPTNLGAIAGNTQVSLFWTASTGATSYNIYRGTTSGGEVLVQSGVAFPEYVDNGLTNGVTYFYEVTAVSAAGESTRSNEAHATPLATNPLPPTGLRAEYEGNITIALTWNASQNAEAYEVLRSTSPGGPFTGIGQPVQTTFVDNSVTPGTTYYYEVFAIAVLGAGGPISGPSNVASATAGTIAPNAPTNLTAAPGSQQVTLGWTASTGATSYNIYRGTSSGNENPVPVKTGVTTTSYVDPGLTNGTTYYYEVSAVNGGGESANSNEASATPFGSPASAVFVKTDTTTSGSWKGAYGGDGFNIITDTSANNPTNPSYAALTPSGNSVFQWVAPGAGLPTSDLQQAATGSTNRLAGVWYSATSFSLDLNMTDGNAHQVALYLLDFGSAGRGETVTITDAVSNAVLDTRTFTNFGTGNYEVYKISGHVKVTFTKTAGNNCVLSAYFFDPPPPPPAAPTGLTATPGNGQATLNWTASTGATSYNIYRATTSGGEGTTPIKTGVTTTSFVDTTVTNGTTYFYEVTAVNANGESGKSNEASATPSNTLATVSFVKQDTTTSGNWVGVYGADGFNVITDPSANNPKIPTYATVTPTGNSSFQWAAPSASNPTYCPQQTGPNSTSRVAGVWFSATNFSLDLNLTDGNVHQFSMYLLDWLSAGRAETVTITDATTNAVLDTRSVTGFGNGVYEVYNISGHVKITFTKTAGNNCVMSAFFFK